jgi:hypothetical protein
MPTNFRAWCERQHQRHAAHLEKVKRIGVARYSLYWAAAFCLAWSALIGIDFYSDNCCGHSMFEIAQFVGVFALLMGIVFFVLTYVIVRVDLWLSSRS